MKNIKFKICFAILLFCLFCSISFAAIVADFDGQAFVTKNDEFFEDREINNENYNNESFNLNFKKNIFSKNVYSNIKQLL